MGDVYALEDDPAAARRRESHDRIHQRRLTDAVASEQSQDLPLLDLQGHSLQHVGITVIGVDVLNVQNRHNSTGAQIDFLYLCALADLLGGCRFQDFTEMEDRDVVGDVEDDVHVVLDQEDRKVAIKSAEKFRHL